MTTRSSTGNAVIEHEFPMFVLGRDLRVRFANYKAHRLLGYEHGTLNGLRVEQVMAPSRRRETCNVNAVLSGKAPRRWSSAVRALDGSIIQVNFSLEPCLDDHGQVVAVVLHCERILPKRVLRAVPWLRLVPNPTVAPRVTTRR